MNPYLYAYIALDVANERAREMNHRRLLAEARAAQPARHAERPAGTRQRPGAREPQQRRRPCDASTSASPTTSVGASLRRSRAAGLAPGTIEHPNGG